MRVVIALGGNALLRRGEPLEAEVQRAQSAGGHGDGAGTDRAPTTRSWSRTATVRRSVCWRCRPLPSRTSQPYPLDVLGAESEGMIGYLIEQALANALPGREIATLLTQVEVDRGRSGLRAIPPSRSARSTARPSSADSPRARTGRSCPTAAAFAVRCRRREPRRIREINVIKLSAACRHDRHLRGRRRYSGRSRRCRRALHGVEAVIDKDLSAALLATAIGADFLLLLTDVPAVWTCWPRTAGEPIGRVTPAALRRYAFDPGSMAPKVEAACRFVEQTGRVAAIGAVEDAEAMLAGDAGTIVSNQD